MSRISLIKTSQGYALIKTSQGYGILVNDRLVGTVYYEPTELVASRWRANVRGPLGEKSSWGRTRKHAVNDAIKQAFGQFKKVTASECPGCRSATRLRKSTGMNFTCAALHEEVTA
jgi:hypothetical protein